MRKSQVRERDGRSGRKQEGRIKRSAGEQNEAHWIQLSLHLRAIKALIHLQQGHFYQLPHLHHPLTALRESTVVLLRLLEPSPKLAERHRSRAAGGPLRSAFLITPPPPDSRGCSASDPLTSITPHQRHRLTRRATAAAPTAPTAPTSCGSRGCCG